MSLPYMWSMEPRAAKASLADLPDDTLAVRAQEGERDAGTVLFRRYWRMGRAIALAAGFREDDAHSLYGDVFLQCLQPGRFDPARGPFKRYFRKAMRTETQRVRARQRGAESESLDALVDEHDRIEYLAHQRADDYDAERAQLRAIVRTLVAEWSTGRTRRRQRRQWARMAQLIYLGDHTIAEAAATMGVSAKSIHNCLTRQINPAIRSRIEGPDRHDRAKSDEAGQHASLEP